MSYRQASIVNPYRAGMKKRKKHSPGQRVAVQIR